MKKKVAIFPAGTEIGLEINRALKYSTFLEVFGFTSLNDHSKYVYANYIEGIPMFSDADFIEELNAQLIKHEIDFIFPAHDDVQLYLTVHSEKIATEVITSDIETVKICRSKIDTYKYFSEMDFIPKMYLVDEVTDFPVFIKPNVGQGAKGAKLIRNKDELELAFQENPQIVISEYLPGEEYTIDCFTDFNGDLRVCKLRNRKRIKTGISVNSEILEMNPEVTRIANIINDKLKLNGAWFFQLKRDVDNNYKLMEVAPRISGTMGVSRNTGINFELLTIFNYMKLPITIIDNKYNIEVDRAFISRFITDLEYDTVYLDLDDTLIVNDKVNSVLMMYLYQTKNKGKRINLISKHALNIPDTLKKYHIGLELFDEIIHIDKADDKHKYVNPDNAIFIDDSFSERYDMSTNTGIPVFDCSEIEALIDWR